MNQNKLSTLALTSTEEECLQYIKEYVNKNNIEEIIKEYEETIHNLNKTNYNINLYNRINESLKEIKSNLLISLVVDKPPYIKELTQDKIINLTGQSGSGKSTYAKEHFNTDEYLIIDTDEVLSENRFKNATGINKEIGEYLRSKYQTLPNLSDNFDLIYQEILTYCKDKPQTIVIDCAQFHCIKDISLLKGTIIIIRTSIHTCYDRCISRYKETNSDYKEEDLIKYSTKKKSLFEWYKQSNEFISIIDNI